MKQQIALDETELGQFLKTAVKSALSEYDQEKNGDPQGDVVFTINQIAKRLKMAHATIKKLVTNGIIQTTRDGKITHSALNQYLKKS